MIEGTIKKWLDEEPDLWYLGHRHKLTSTQVCKACLENPSLLSKYISFGAMARLHYKDYVGFSNYYNKLDTEEARRVKRMLTCEQLSIKDYFDDA